MTPAFEIGGADRPSRWLITCDHATNAVPDWICGGDLGIGSADMSRHIAYDVGAKGVADALGEALDAPVIASTWSRLCIDPNRGEDDPTLLMRLYDGTVIPANRAADERERERRLDRLWRPYHAAVARLAGRGDDTVYCAVHTFTPQLRGRPPRPWKAAVLYSPLDDRLARPLIALLEAEGDIFPGDNQPYSGHLPGDSVDRHALQAGRPNVLVEIRNDLVRTPEDQRAWGERLAPLLSRALQMAGV